MDNLPFIGTLILAIIGASGGLYATWMARHRTNAEAQKETSSAEKEQALAEEARARTQDIITQAAERAVELTQKNVEDMLAALEQRTQERDDAMRREAVVRAELEAAKSQQKRDQGEIAEMREDLGRMRERIAVLEAMISNAGLKVPTWDGTTDRRTKPRD